MTGFATDMYFLHEAFPDSIGRNIRGRAGLRPNRIPSRTLHMFRQWARCPS